MELYDEQPQVMETKKSKLPAIIGVCIVMLTILAVAIIFGIIYLKDSLTTITLDMQRNYELEKILYVEEDAEGFELYVPIIKMAKILGYEGFSGDYLNKSEDKTKCHVVSENETAMFTLDSDVLVKLAKGSEEEYITLDKSVFEKDGELYTTKEGIEKAFNITISTDKKFKNINIFSMDYLITYWTKELKLEEYSEDFLDKKAIFENMVIIQNENRYGVINIETGKAILETKYEEIKYLPMTTDFIVKINNKYGIMAKDATTKVNAVYDSIETMDNKNGLYLVKQNNAYGVININGEIVIEPEYSQIGIDINQYSQNGVKNAFILLNEIIPIKNSEGLWALFNIKGEKITEFKYTGIGCQKSSASNSYATVVIPSYNITVVQTGEFYNLVSAKGQELAPENKLEAVYLKVNASTEQNEYYMMFNNKQKIVNIEEWLASAED